MSKINSNFITNSSSTGYYTKLTYVVLTNMIEEDVLKTLGFDLKLKEIDNFEMCIYFGLVDDYNIEKTDDFKQWLDKQYPEGILNYYKSKEWYNEEDYSEEDLIKDEKYDLLYDNGMVNMWDEWHAQKSNVQEKFVKSLKNLHYDTISPACFTKMVFDNTLLKLPSQVKPQGVVYAYTRNNGDNEDYFYIVDCQTWSSTDNIVSC